MKCIPFEWVCIYGIFCEAIVILIELFFGRITSDEEYEKPKMQISSLGPSSDRL